jgi:futalosine hydrolase
MIDEWSDPAASELGSSLLGCRRVLVVTAVEAELQAVLNGLGDEPVHDHGGVSRRVAGVTFVRGGVGVAAAAAATARCLTAAGLSGRPFDAVVSAGIGGGFAGRVPVGAVALADRSIAADLGADSPDGFCTLDELGFGTSAQPVSARLLARLRDALPAAVAGPILTVSTVTGTAATARRLTARYPGAVAEAMEGFGVATAAAFEGVPFVEVRAISNLVGPRDRAAWRIDAALSALYDAFAALARWSTGPGPVLPASPVSLQP